MNTRLDSAGDPRRPRPRVGFVGVGWIGRHRLEAVAADGAVEIAAIADPALAQRREAARVAPDAIIVDDIEQLWGQELDGVVIATPSAQHAQQSIAALERGLAVFCQKPLGRTSAEAAAVVAAAQRADRLLAVDFCYRHVEAMRRIRSVIREGAIGRVFAVDLVFHNAYGPDKPWFYDRAQSGGGCLMDLGVHLVDLLLWTLDYPSVVDVRGRALANASALSRCDAAVEDYAIAQLELAGGVAVSLACSWRLPAGCDARIEVSFYGTRGGASCRNLDGSFFDFVADLHRGTSSARISPGNAKRAVSTGVTPNQPGEREASPHAGQRPSTGGFHGREASAAPPDAWGGRAICAWARQLAEGAGFDPRARRLVDVSAVIDRIYGSVARP